jgi:hypothetical protein
MRAIVECLKCGLPRAVRGEARLMGAGECPRCGYVGWAPSDDLREDDRRQLRDVPVELRRISPTRRAA